MALEQPVPVEPFLELEQRMPELLEAIEVPPPKQLFLERLDEPLGHAIARTARSSPGHKDPARTPAFFRH